MNLTLRQLRAFLAVARTASFTTAAEELFLTQSAVSGLIKELEHGLGLRLFDRSTRRLQLSGAGSELHPRIEKIMQDLATVIDEVGHIKALHRGVVRIAAPQLMSSTILPKLMAQFQTQHPQVQLHLIDTLVEKVVGLVFTGEVDIGMGPERAANSDIVAGPWFKLPFMAVLPPTHALCARRQLTWQQLSQYPLITLQGQFTDLLAHDLGSARRKLTLSATREVHFMSTALSMVQAGLGLTVCIPYALNLVQQHGLVLRPIRQPVIERAFYVFSRRGSTLSHAAQAFYNFLQDRADAVGALE